MITNITFSNKDGFRIYSNHNGYVVDEECTHLYFKMIEDYKDYSATLHALDFIYLNKTWLNILHKELIEY